MIETAILATVDLIALREILSQRIADKEVKDHELKLGYTSSIFYRKPIIINMLKTPHLFVCGLSGSGKTKMIEFAVKGKRVVLLNAFENDFKNIAGQRITGNENILAYLNELLRTMKTRSMENIPFYVVIDELLVLCMDKAITKAIMDILAIGRHYNIFLIGISQIGTKEAVKFKDLFNARVCFRQVEESSYRTILGYSPENKQLRQREFYLYADLLARGKTYKIHEGVF